MAWFLRLNLVIEKHDDFIVEAGLFIVVLLSNQLITKLLADWNKNCKNFQILSLYLPYYIEYYP